MALTKVTGNGLGAFTQDGAAVFNEGSADVDFRVESNSTANMLLVDAGNDTVLFTKSAPAFDNVGVEIAATGRGQFCRDGGVPLFLNRKTDNGNIVEFRKNNTTFGMIGTVANAVMYLGSFNTGLVFEGFFDDSIVPFSPTDEGIRDDAIDLGYGSSRFDDIFATNTSITTSDETEKQQISTLTSAEMTAAKAISALFKTYKWNKSVTNNGDAARTHTGVIAQEVQAAMSAAGLDATKYAFWCSNTWWETTTEVAAVEADKDNEIEAKDAFTRVEQYHTEDAAPEGATKRTRLGVRYPELLAFVGAATEQRLADIETRLTALENA